MNASATLEPTHAPRHGSIETRPLESGLSSSSDRLRLLHQPGEIDGAAATFERIKSELRTAEDRVEIFMYVWRSDEIGNEIGRAVLEAADRGVRVHILKDLGAFLFERVEMNRKSLFNLKLPTWKSLAYRLLRPSFPDTYVEDAFGDEVGQALMAHPGVSFEWVNKTHTKYYVFDERKLMMGSINLEDRHRDYYDYMLELDGVTHVERMRERMAGVCDPEAERAVEFYVNAHDADGRTRMEIRPRLLELIEDSDESIDVEMAYLGDEAITEALVEAALRGARVRFLFSPEANIGNEINYHTMRQIALRAPVEVYFTPKMIHSKMMLFDGRRVMMGSANLSVFSLQKAEEVNVEIREGEGEVVEDFRVVFADRLGQSRRMENPEELAGYSRLKAHLQQGHQKMNPN